jgi:hypothetical protein
MMWDPAEFDNWYNRLPLGEQRRRVWKDLSSDQRKLWNEWSTFRAFASAAPLDIDPRTIKGCSSPLADILCLISGKPHYFELGEVTDEGLARRTSIAAKEGKSIFGGSFMQWEPLCRIYDQKCSNTYDTQGHKLHLLLYFSTDRQVPYTEALQIDIARERKRVEQKLHNSPFTSAWLFDGWEQLIIGHIER